MNTATELEFETLIQDIEQEERRYEYTTRLRHVWATEGMSRGLESFVLKQGFLNTVSSTYLQLSLEHTNDNVLSREDVLMQAYEGLWETIKESVVGLFQKAFKGLHFIISKIGAGLEWIKHKIFGLPDHYDIATFDETMKIYQKEVDQKRQFSIAMNTVYSLVTMFGAVGGAMSLGVAGFGGIIVGIIVGGIMSHAFNKLVNAAQGYDHKSDINSPYVKMAAKYTDGDGLIKVPAGKGSELGYIELDPQTGKVVSKFNEFGKQKIKDGKTAKDHGVTAETVKKVIQEAGKGTDASKKAISSISKEYATMAKGSKSTLEKTENDVNEPKPSGFVSMLRTVWSLLKMCVLGFFLALYKGLKAVFSIFCKKKEGKTDKDDDLGDVIGDTPEFAM